MITPRFAGQAKATAYSRGRLLIVDDRIVSRSEYPSRENLAMWTGIAIKPKANLPMADSGGCCGDTGCC